MNAAGFHFPKNLIMLDFPYKGTNQDIERIADSLRQSVISKRQNEELRGRQLLDATIGLTGGRIELTDDPSIQEVEGGSLVIHGVANFTVYLSPYTTPLRDNFTIAHELGHYVLHFFLQNPKPATPKGFTRYGSGPIEWQANRFAGAFLIPAEQFRNQFEVTGGDGFLLAGYFGVSRPAIEARGESLGHSVK